MEWPRVLNQGFNTALFEGNQWLISPTLNMGIPPEI